MWILSIIALGTSATICLFGVYHNGFRDNLVQCVGMCGLCVGCLSRIEWVWNHHTTEPGWLLVHASVALCLVGTAQKAVIHHGRTAGWGWIRKFDTWRVTARGELDEQPHHWGA